jgi:thymidylate synthase (FAD)
VLCEIVAAWVPLVWEAFEDYRLSGAAISGPGLAALRGLIDPAALDDEARLEGLREKSGMNTREFRELIELLRQAS